MPKGFVSTKRNDDVGFVSTKRNDDVGFVSTKSNDDEADKERKKWLVEQTKYHFQLSSDSLDLEMRKMEESYKNMQSSFQSVLRGILAGVGFMATLVLGIGTANIANFPLTSLLLADFVVGALLYLYFSIIASKVTNKFSRILPGYYELSTILNVMKGSFGALALSLDKLSIKQIELFNAYISIALSGRFTLREIYQDILSTTYLKYYHKRVESQYYATEITIAAGLQIFKDNRDELLKEKAVTEIDEATPQIFAAVSQVNREPLFKLYDKEAKRQY